MSVTQAHFLSMRSRQERVVRYPAVIFTLGLWLTLTAAEARAEDTNAAEHYATCSAYFFMAANAKAMGEFNGYYTAGEYALNLAVRLAGERSALERFNAASTEINELIGRRWTEFEKADNRYGIVCADILRDASNPDR